MNTSTFMRQARGGDGGRANGGMGEEGITKAHHRLRPEKSSNFMSATDWMGLQKGEKRGFVKGFQTP